MLKNDLFSQRAEWLLRPSFATSQPMYFGFVLALLLQVVVFTGIVVYNLVAEQYDNDPCSPRLVKDEPILATTKGCFRANTSLALGLGVNWAGSNENFRQFHLDSTLRDSKIRELSESMRKYAGTSDFAVAETFYIFKGCTKIKYVTCPSFIGCLFTVSWSNGTWAVDSFLFPLRIAKLPQHIVSRVTDPQYPGAHYPVMAIGSFRGHLCFNAIEFGAKFKSTDPAVPLPGHKLWKYTYTKGLVLPTNLPDGVIALQDL